MSSRTGLRRADGQRLGPLLAVLCGPTTPILHAAARHPSPPVRRALDLIFGLVGADQRHGVRERDLSASGLPARLFEPDGAGANAPLLVFFHGGGFVLGSLDSHAETCRLVAREAGSKVLAIHYRWAPEDRFPAALDDAVAAFRWAVAHANELGVDADRIVVGGDSAGGNVAAGVCVAVAEDEVTPRGAWLAYPFVDADITAWQSARLFAKGPLLSTRCASDMLAQYAPVAADQGDPRVSVLAADPAVMPPTYVATAGMDPLRDQGEAFAARLREAGIDVRSRRFAALPHGFALLLVDRRARGATVEMSRALAALQTTTRGPSASRSIPRRETEVSEKAAQGASSSQRLAEDRAVPPNVDGGSGEATAAEMPFEDRSPEDRS